MEIPYQINFIRPGIFTNGQTITVELKTPITVYFEVRKVSIQEKFIGSHSGNILYNVTSPQFGISFVAYDVEDTKELLEQEFSNLFIGRYITTIINEMHLPLKGNDDVGTNLLKYIKQVTIN